VYRLYEFPDSGNCYKVRLLLTQLGADFERVFVDIMAGEARTPGFLRRNPAGKVPVLEIGEGDFLPESNAALWYLSEGTDFLPHDRRGRAEVFRWLSFEQYSHEPNVATPRFWIKYLGSPPELSERLARRQEAGRQALRVMDDHLSERRFFVGDRYTIADIALYAYSHVADEGGIDLGPYSAVRRWIDRTSDQPGHVTMDA
jgi:glutathione S-transferase